MGEAKRKLEFFLENSPFCILCGGHKKAETRDHIPPKSMFLMGLWPEGYVFPACETCNKGSSQDDQLVAFIAKMCHDMSPEDFERELKKQIHGIQYIDKNFFSYMFNVSLRQKRNFAKKAKLAKRQGESLADIPMVRIPPRAAKAVEVFAAKVTKAVYYKITTKILPLEAAIYFAWYTNEQTVKGETQFLDEIMQGLIGEAQIKRDKVNLNDQFYYSYAVSPEHDLMMMVCFIGKSFCFISMLSVNPLMIQKIFDKTKREPLKRIYWPK